jgi:hypothetical protein
LRGLKPEIEVPQRRQIGCRQGLSQCQRIMVGNYNAVCASYEQARNAAPKSGDKLRFRRYNGEGRITNQRLCRRLARSRRPSGVGTISDSCHSSSAGCRKLTCERAPSYPPPQGIASRPLDRDIHLSPQLIAPDRQACYRHRSWLASDQRHYACRNRDGRYRS